MSLRPPAAPLAIALTLGLGLGLAACQGGNDASATKPREAAAQPSAPQPSAPQPSAPQPSAPQPLPAPPAPPPTGPSGGTPYAKDIDRICNAEAYSGALDQPEEARQLMVAQWLGPHLETQDAHDFLVRIQPMGAKDKGAALDAEAKKVGLGACPLARVWSP